MTDPTSGIDPWKLAHIAWAGLAAVVAWVGRDHVKRDDARFDSIKEEMSSLSTKLDAANTQTAANHAEVLKILIERLPPSA